MRQRIRATNEQIRDAVRTGVGGPPSAWPDPTWKVPFRYSLQLGRGSQCGRGVAQDACDLHLGHTNSPRDLALRELAAEAQ